MCIFLKLSIHKCEWNFIFHTGVVKVSAEGHLDFDNITCRPYQIINLKIIRLQIYWILNPACHSLAGSDQVILQALNCLWAGCSPHLMTGSLSYIRPETQKILALRSFHLTDNSIFLSELHITTSIIISF